MTKPKPKPFDLAYDKSCLGHIDEVLRDCKIACDISLQDDQNYPAFRTLGIKLRLLNTIYRDIQSRRVTRT